VTGHRVEDAPNRRLLEQPGAEIVRLRLRVDRPDQRDHHEGAKTRSTHNGHMSSSFPLHASSYPDAGCDARPSDSAGIRGKWYTSGRKLLASRLDHSLACTT